MALKILVLIYGFLLYLNKCPPNGGGEGLIKYGRLLNFFRFTWAFIGDGSLKDAGPYTGTCTILRETINGFVCLSIEGNFLQTNSS